MPELSAILFDMYGRLVMDMTTYDNQVLLYRELLSPGTYIFRLITDGQVKASGKLIVI